MLTERRNGTDGDHYRVLVNPKGRYGLWPAHSPLPPSWREVIGGRPKAECLDYLRKAWSGPAPERPRVRPKVDFGIMFFGGGEYAAAAEKYRLLIECARFADARGFSAVWLPERHFTKLGCLYPNPAVLHAALARETQRIRLRAGSVVLPLHNPIRIAEEWAVVDNLSAGRVDVSFASGWNPEDFALYPEKYRRRHAEMYDGIRVIERLWSGQTIPATGGDGKALELRVYPSPVQPKLPIWLTAAENPATFQQAGELGANLLTHLFDMTVEKLGAMIAIYREARERSGHDPATGRVAVALHTFIADDLEGVRRHSYTPYCNYLKSNLGLVAKLAAGRGLDLDLSRMTEAQLDEVVAFLFEKYLRGRSLLGTPESCAELVVQLAGKGVDEVACLVDFGPAPEAILESLEPLHALKESFS